MAERQRYKLSVAVFVFLRKENQLLMLQRKNTGWMDGHFSVPAGALDGNEPLEKAAARESGEEVAVEINPEDLQLVHLMHNSTEGNEWIGAFFFTTKWLGEPKVNEPHKHSQVNWVEITQLPEKTIPYVKQAIEKSQKGIAYSTFGWDHE